jgi:hypothetical protein
MAGGLALFSVVRRNFSSPAVPWAEAHGSTLKRAPQFGSLTLIRDG